MNVFGFGSQPFSYFPFASDFGTNLLVNVIPQFKHTLFTFLLLPQYCLHASSPHTQPLPTLLSNPPGSSPQTSQGNHMSTVQNSRTTRTTSPPPLTRAPPRLRFSTRALRRHARSALPFFDENKHAVWSWEVDIKGKHINGAGRVGRECGCVCYRERLKRGLERVEYGGGRDTLGW